MRKTKLALLALTAALAVTACGGKKEKKVPETVSAAETQATEATEATEAKTLAPATDEEKAKAAEVGKKIDAIYVQNWSEDTEKLCKEAKEAWDALILCRVTNRVLRLILTMNSNCTAPNLRERENFMKSMLALC